MSENKARYGFFIEYVGKTIYPGSVNQLDFNAGYDSRDPEVGKLEQFIMVAHSLMIHGQNEFVPSELQSGLYRDFINKAISLRAQKNRISNDTRK